jgi:hypothetical protein
VARGHAGDGGDTGPGQLLEPPVSLYYFAASLDQGQGNPARGPASS